MMFFVNFQRIVFQDIYLILKQKFHLFKFFNFTVIWRWVWSKPVSGYRVFPSGGTRGNPPNSPKNWLVPKNWLEIEFLPFCSCTVSICVFLGFSTKNKLINLYRKLNSYFKTESTFGLNILIFRKPSYLS